MRGALQAYPQKLLSEDTPKSLEAYVAIKAALKKTQEKPYDGPDRVKLIRMLFIKKTHKVNGAAAELNISYRTAQRWVQDFITEVSRNMGYI